MTPSHDGSRTPGAWDPSITNTPSRSDPDGYNLDDGFGQTSTGPYTPQTPGGMYGSDQSYSPYQITPSPTGYHSMSKYYIRLEFLVLCSKLKLYFFNKMYLIVKNKYFLSVKYLLIKLI